MKTLLKIFNFGSKVTRSKDNILKRELDIWAMKSFGREAATNNT